MTYGIDEEPKAYARKVDSERIDIIWNGQVKGSVYKRDTYITPRRPSHYFFTQKGFGITVAILRTCQDLGVFFVQVVYDCTRGRFYYGQPLWALMETKTVKPGEDWDEQKVLVVQDEEEQKLLYQDYKDGGLLY